MRPFKPLTIRKPEIVNEVQNPPTDKGPPLKRRKLSPADDEIPSANTPPITGHVPASQPREPLKPRPNAPSPPKDGANVPTSAATHFTVLWRNPTAKKNKTWTGDGVLSVSGGFATFCDSNGKPLGRCAFSRPLLSGSTLTVGGKEIEIDAFITRDEFLAIVQSKPKSTANALPKATSTIKSPPTAVKKQEGSLQDQLRAAIKKGKDAQAKPLRRAEDAWASPQVTQQAFKRPVKGKEFTSLISNDSPTPRYDPFTSGAIVFKRPKRVNPGRQIVDVVLDPALGRRLHDHQKEGVKFLYECVNGIRDSNGHQGCILADDMGLGKTVQTIALLWTLIKQNPVYRDPPVVKKALVVCPVSVIQNWKKEFKKWLPHANLGVLIFDEKTSLRLFDGRVYNVMIIGYERLRLIADELADSHDIDIVVCDEGHRLKTENNKCAKAIQALQTTRRVILSGTPIQNDLSEFYCMVNFVNDGVLGSAKAFARNFENPILKSRQPHATDDTIEKGEEAAAELSRTTRSFILRRTADILSTILPTKTEYVLFCKPTTEQATVYKRVVSSPMFNSAMGGSGSEIALQLITILKKLCNSPALLKPNSTSDQSTSTSLQTLNEMLSPSLSRYYRNDLSAKIRLLDVLLQEIRRTTDEKVVLVSNYTSTLNLMANLLDNSGLKYLRLDGSVNAKKRQGLVDQFNNSPSSNVFAFLLSAKAGGIGINLIGASRLVLFDVDWNPATDDQAIARIHRQGQKRPTKIYRFLVKGGLEERIWQRQVVKRGLAESIMDGGDGSDSKTYKGRGGAAFSQDELRDLFRFDESDGLRTHDLIRCGCRGRGIADIEEEERTTSKEASFLEETPPSPVREDTPDLPDFNDIVRASQLSTEADGTVSPRKRASNKYDHSQNDVEAEELMKYSHLDTSTVPMLDEDSEELEKVHLNIDDPCLTHVLRRNEDEVASSIAYVFKRVWGSKSCHETGSEVAVQQEDLKSDVFVETN